MNAALKIEHLNKSFGKRQILHDISLETYQGEVFGFLGPNGAGKTTTIKIAVGLLALEEGEIFINGVSVQKDFEKAMAGVGGIVENPELYKHLSGLDNLRQYARMRGGVDEKRIAEVVELVGLTNRIREKISKYSLGMRQRLGVAQAILHRPKLLILDEPTNGLDPAGIKDLRDILKRLAHEEGVGVLVSSHLMSEMELMCDRVGIIVQGKLLEVKTIEEMVSTAHDETIHVTMKVSEPERALELVETAVAKKLGEDGLLQLTLSHQTADEQIADIIAALVGGGIRVMSCVPEENRKLEDVFIELTKSGGVQIG